MKRFCIRALTAALIIFGLSSPAQAKFVGIVKNVQGEAFIVRQAKTLKVSTNTPVALQDIVKTGATGSLGMIFKDDTVVSMGPASELVVEDFIFSPADEKLSFVARVIRGTIAFLSGQIAKLSPEKVRLETPDATIGMRGTQVLVKVQ
jgi:hypothetical protein